MTITRTIAAVATMAAMAVPAAAQAQPPDMHASVAQAAAKARNAQEAKQQAAAKQDLRSPDTRDAAVLRRQAPVDAPGATAAGSASRPAPPVAPGQPTWPVNPQPIAPAPEPVASTSDGDGVDWAPIGAGIIGGLLAVGGIAALAGRRRSHRLRVAA
jgi:hypothetical protein